MTAALVESLRRSVGADPSPEGAVKLPLYNIFVRSRRERERVPLLPAAGETEQKTGGLPQSRPRTQHHCPAVASGFFPRRTKAGISNIAYPRSFGRCRAAWRQFSGFSPRRFRVFHDTNTLEVP